MARVSSLPTSVDAWERAVQTRTMVLESPSARRIASGQLSPGRMLSGAFQHEIPREWRCCFIASAIAASLLEWLMKASNLLLFIGGCGVWLCRSTGRGALVESDGPEPPAPPTEYVSGRFHRRGFRDGSSQSPFLANPRRGLRTGVPLQFHGSGIPNGRRNGLRTVFAREDVVGSLQAPDSFVSQVHPDGTVCTRSPDGRSYASFK